MVTGHFEYAIFGVIAAVMVYLIVARGGFSQRRELHMIPKLLVSHEKNDVPRLLMPLLHILVRYLVMYDMTRFNLLD